MTEQFPPPPPQQPIPPQGGQPYYAQPPKKSNTLRNVLIGVTAFFILMCGGCFAIVGIGANEVAKEVDDAASEASKNLNADAEDNPKHDSAVDEEPKEQQKTATVGTKGNPAPRGKAVENKSARYQIDNVELKDSLNQFTDPPAGKYVVITITVQNVKDESIQVSSEDFMLEVDGYEVDTSDQAYVLDNAFTYEDLSPGLKKTGVIVFDVQPKAAGKGILKAQAMLSMDEAIYLNVAQ
ncbi:DUF4352 domain-containing protein [Nocardioides sp. LHD-245]|uniref:DUF4352 domain-containing protein n=1 Tax=Nocardioides sp. LHD-245 TaxID=3051387 RepID=UPI0027E13C4E|nr:DUF4352 domain-containing protein [Nocardioides sp. LHD-245]